MKFKNWIPFTFLSFIICFSACLNDSQSTDKIKINPDNWTLMGIHPDLTDSIEFTDQDIFIDSNWYQIDAASYGDLYRFYFHNHYLYQKGDQKAVKLGPIQDTMH